MIQTSVNQFRSNLRQYVDDAIQTHRPIKVTRRNGGDFIVMSAEDWEQWQETLYVLQNQSLMQQIADSLATHQDEGGYTPSAEELNEIVGV